MVSELLTVLWETPNDSTMASLANSLLEPLFLRVYEIHI